MTRNYRQRPPASAAQAAADTPGCIDADDDALDAQADAESPPELRDWVVAAGQHGQRLDRVVAAGVPEFSRSHAQVLIAEGDVVVDGAPRRSASRPVNAGQRVQVRVRLPASARAFTPEPMAIATVYEDEHLRVVNKPAGLVVHPAAGNWHGTLLNGLLALDAQAAALPRAGIVHRLDKDTSGLMVVARSAQAMTALVRAMAERRIHRRYLALAHGALADADTRVAQPVGRDPVVRVRMAVVASGKPALTDLQRLAVVDGVSALRCVLHTGRTHQIRVHLAWLGHPLLADALYGGAAHLGLARQALHASELALDHPITGKPWHWHAPLPTDLAAAWTQLGLREPGVSG